MFIAYFEQLNVCIRRSDVVNSAITSLLYQRIGWSQFLSSGSGCLQTILLSGFVLKLRNCFNSFFTRNNNLIGAAYCKQAVGDDPSDIVDFTFEFTGIGNGEVEDV